MVNRAHTYQQAQSVSKKPSEEVNTVEAKKCSQYQQGKRNKNQPQPNKGKGQPTEKECPGCDSEKHKLKVTCMYAFFYYLLVLCALTKNKG